jgi:hypothetical protein
MGCGHEAAIPQRDLWAINAQRPLLVAAIVSPWDAPSLRGWHSGLQPRHNSVLTIRRWHYLVNGRRMIERDRLMQRWKGVSDEDALAARCNAMLDWSAWGPPPWSGAQWQTLRVVLEMVG